MLRVEGVDVFYDDVQALWRASIEVQQGEIVALIGSNGAGKSTMLRTISGLLKPAAGSVQFLGQSIGVLPPHRVAELGIAHVPEGRRLFPMMTVLENLEIGSLPAEARRRRAESLERVFDIFPKLRDRKTQLAGTLSGGEQQMVAIGRGLMANPKLLMLDEPSLGLAPKLVREVFATVERIHSEGVTILLVEQNVHQALSLADHAFVLENGRITLGGTGREILSNEHVQKVYLGTA
jgi:branched-chain amino acid transport system ATP-binding protein